MDDPNQENIESSWVMINTIDIAEEATTLNCNVNLGKVHKEDNNVNNMKLDGESNEINIISECSNLHEGNNEEEHFVNNVYQKNDGSDIVQKRISDHISPEDALQQKANWTFVDSEPVPPEMTSSNQFYLNCLQEPVQELSEHELGSVQSDLESDSISIISDCESLIDSTDNEIKLSQDVLAQENCDNERMEVGSKLPPGIKKYCNGVLIGTILLATTSIFLGQYFNSVEQMEEELPIYKEEYKNELKENVADKINEKYEVPTALAYCQERHKTDTFMEQNINKCLKQIKNRMKRKKENKIKKEEIKKLEKYLKMKEQYLDEKEQFLIKREYELLKAELKLKQEVLNKNKIAKVHLEELNKNADESSNDFIKSEFSKESKMNKYEKHIEQKQKRHKNIKDKIKYDKSENYSFKNLHKSKKDKNINGQNENIVYSWKHKTTKFLNLMKQEKHKNIVKNRKDKKITNNEHGFTTENYNKNKKVITDDLHLNSREDIKSNKLKERKTKSSTNYIILENNNNNQTVSGYWVGKLYKGRNDIRSKKHGGDWYFDRASYRKTKRDKAKWYFDWMMDREMLRYKRSF